MHPYYNYEEEFRERERERERGGGGGKNGPQCAVNENSGDPGPVVFADFVGNVIEPRHEKNNDVVSEQVQHKPYKHRRWLDAGNFGF